jgi:hypothetical protein
VLIGCLTLPDFSEISSSQLLGQADLRSGNFVLVSRRVLQGVTPAIPRLLSCARLGQLAAEALAESTLVAGHQVLQGGEGLTGGDEVPAVVVQRFDLVVLDVVQPVLKRKVNVKIN